YRDRLRGFYFDIEKDAPGPIVENEEDLFEAIDYALENGHVSPEAFKSFQDRFCYLEDGKATERVVKQLFAR
ncbi:CDP-glycerol glycerophosphotransferase family protein, partial [Microvirga sp. 3-52]|nr:CDP-glycerol glycerophosphotransferase family protein [Microvirga sp. 3-52]